MSNSSIRNTHETLSLYHPDEIHTCSAIETPRDVWPAEVVLKAYAGKCCMIEFGGGIQRCESLAVLRCSLHLGWGGVGASRGGAHAPGYHNTRLSKKSVQGQGRGEADQGRGRRTRGGDGQRGFRGRQTSSRERKRCVRACLRASAKHSILAQTAIATYKYGVLRSHSVTFGL